MDWGLDLQQLKALIVLELAAWLTMALMNNIIDRRTNVHLLRRMMSMIELEDDPVLGKGLLWRACGSRWLPVGVLHVVIVTQCVIVILLWRGAYLLVTSSDPASAVTAANLGLGTFASLWFVFLTGGMWFGYWMKMPQVQQVHLTLLLISVAAMVLVNH